jgi:eukaryotic-like serine/threonine-protein kinase
MSDVSLADGRFVPDFASPLPDAWGGVPAFACADRAGDRAVMALLAEAARPPRADALAILTTAAPDGPAGILNPLAHGPIRLAASEGYAIVVDAPPSRPLSLAKRAWSEPELLALVIRPAALALERLASFGLTHRAIRPDNLAIRRGGVVLGPAWAAPPACHQTAVFEPPYVAMCHPSGRGAGTVADDVYALGATVLALLRGGAPISGLDEESVIRRKLEVGSFMALAGEDRLPAGLGDLLRAMLADDPLHRPPLTLLADPRAVRSVRPVGRPPARAARALQVGGMVVREARSLARAIARQPEAAAPLLASGAVGQWIRRDLGDPALALRVDEVGRTAGRLPGQEARAIGAAIAMQAVAVLDPLAPLCWGGLAWWPDGVGALYAACGSQAEAAVAILSAIESEAPATWAGLRAERCDVAVVRGQARAHRLLLHRGGSRPANDGPGRLLYALNPLLSCASPLLAGRWIARLGDLLPALEALAGTRPAGLPFDAHIAAFAAARGDDRVQEAVLNGVGESGAQTALRALAAIQAGMRTGPLPALAAWLATPPGKLLRACQESTASSDRWNGVIV